MRCGPSVMPWKPLTTACLTSTKPVHAMRYLHALALLLSFGTQSFAQPGSGDQPHRDSTVVWFYLNEAGLLHDTIWSGVNHRREKALVYTMLRNRIEALATCDEELAQAREDNQRLRASVTDVLADRDAEREGRQEAEQAKKGRFWAGAGVGAALVAVVVVLVGAAAP